MSEDTTGLVAVDLLLVWSAAAVAVAAGLGLLWAMVRGIRRIVSRVDEIVDDWHGAPGRPGVEGRPGVMERLDGTRSTGLRATPGGSETTGTGRRSDGLCFDRCGARMGGRR